MRDLTMCWLVFGDSFAVIARSIEQAAELTAMDMRVFDKIWSII